MVTERRRKKKQNVSMDGVLHAIYTCIISITPTAYAIDLILPFL